MRKLVALGLVMVLSSGCYSTMRSSRLAVAPPPVGAAQERLSGLVLKDGTQVRFTGPAVLGADGSVSGRITVDYPALKSATAIRHVTYRAADIARYEIATEQRKFSVGKTVGLVLGLPAFMLVLERVACDPNAWVC